MKITIEVDGEETVYQDVLDYYVCVRQVNPKVGKKKDIVREITTRSYSHTSGGLRDIVKEVRQSLIELQKVLEGYSGGS